MKIIQPQLLSHGGEFLRTVILENLSMFYYTPEFPLCDNITKIETIKVFMKQQL